MSSTAVSNKFSPDLHPDKSEPPQPMDVDQGTRVISSNIAEDHAIHEAEIQPQLEPKSVQTTQEWAAVSAIESEQEADSRNDARRRREQHPHRHDEFNSSQTGPSEDDRQHAHRHRHSHHGQGTQEQQTSVRNEPSQSNSVAADSIERIPGCDQVMGSPQHSEHEPEHKRQRLQTADDAHTHSYKQVHDQSWARTAYTAEAYYAAARRHSNDNDEDSRMSDGNGSYHSSEEAYEQAREEISQEVAHAVRMDQDWSPSPEAESAELAESTESTSQSSNAIQGLQTESALAVATETSQSQSHTSSSPPLPESTTKASRARREPLKKVPKVYPPRKPRMRPIAVEPLTMTIRTDSALSTLASAAVAIKNHQGPISTLSVPPLSPPTQEVESPGLESVSSPTLPEASATTSTSSRATGRSPLKPQVPRDASGYRCELCPGERFGRVHDLKRHQISKHNEMTWPCDFCHRPFVRRDALLRHYSVKAARRDGVHPTDQEENRLKEAKARAKLLA